MKMWKISSAVDLIDERVAEFEINCDKRNGGIHAATSAKMKNTKMIVFIKINMAMSN